MSRNLDESLGSDKTLAGKTTCRSEEDAHVSLGDCQTVFGEAGELLLESNGELEPNDLTTRYEIERTIGKGGMGEVLLALDKRLRRKVAIKRIRGELVRNQAAVSRFLTEAQAIAAINHTNVVQIYDFGRDRNGPFIVMEYVDGQSLLERCDTSPIATEEAVKLTCDLLSGLGRAHDLGVVHRDIKPANILLTHDGVPKLTDFGLAKQTSGDHGQTADGTVLGTIDFMPPEQRRDATLVDARSDLWSLAATFYQMLTGRSPKVIRFDLLPNQLTTVVAKALEEAPNQRFQSAIEFREVLRLAYKTVKATDCGELVAGVCPRCQTKFEDSSRFCHECSSPLIAQCLSCKAEIPVWDKGCRACGSRQFDLLRRKRVELEALKGQVEHLQEMGQYERAILVFESIDNLQYPWLHDIRDWQERVGPILSEQLDRMLELASRALEEARAHRAVWDHPAAIRSLTSLPIETRSEEHSLLLNQLQAEWNEAQETLLTIQSRIKAKQLDGLLPLVQRMVELRGDRADLRKLLEQLTNRESKISAAISHASRVIPTRTVSPESFDRKYTPPKTKKLGALERHLAMGWRLILPLALGAVVMVAGAYLITRFGGNREKQLDLASGPIAASEFQEMAKQDPADTATTVKDKVTATIPRLPPVSSEAPASKPPQIRKSTPNEEIAKNNPTEITNSIDMRMKLIPPGKFTMGSPETEPGRRNDEAQHEVNLTQPFYLGVYEVTQSQFEKVMGRNPSKFLNPNHPVETITWHEAVEFCRKLSELPEEKAAGRIYRLPTEAEWEYSSRAGARTSFSFGDDVKLLSEYGWVDGHSERRPHPVGQKKANAWGLYDMYGNVSEWCSDWHGQYPRGVVVDPKGPRSGKTRLLRGGGWLSGPPNCRSAFRYSFIPSGRSSSDGLRVAMDVITVEHDNRTNER